MQACKTKTAPNKTYEVGLGNMGIFNNINAILGVAVAGLTLFGFFQNKMTNNERRLTILEEKKKSAR